MPVTADSTLWTADTICVTADGRIICIAADVAEAANALDIFDATAIADTTVDNVDAVVVALADLAEAANALDQLDADVVSVEVPVAPVGGRAHRRRPLPVYGIGYGILPPLWGEAHGTVGVVGQSAAQLIVRAAAVGACGQAGNAAAVLKTLSVAGNGAVGTRGTGSGMIVKFSGTATGQQNDDEAAVIAFLLAA
jgi:hypothetical protein